MLCMGPSILHPPLMLCVMLSLNICIETHAAHGSFNACPLTAISLGPGHQQSQILNHLCIEWQLCEHIALSPMLHTCLSMPCVIMCNNTVSQSPREIFLLCWHIQHITLRPNSMPQWNNTVSPIEKLFIVHGHSAHHIETHATCGSFNATC